MTGPNTSNVAGGTMESGRMLPPSVDGKDIVVGDNTGLTSGPGDLDVAGSGSQPNSHPQVQPLGDLSRVALHFDRSGRVVEGVSQQRVHDIERILGQHRYVTVELATDAGLKTVHISRPKDHPTLISVHVVTDRAMDTGARYSSLELRSFLQSADGSPIDPHDSTEAELDAVISQVKEFLAERSKRPLLINVSPQGYHERDRRLVLGLTDTGGQDKFIEDIAAVSAKMGLQVVNVNRGGPNHPKLGDVREGMHYGADHVDILFLWDGNPEFVAKENMYDRVEAERAEDFRQARVVEEGPCGKLAGILLAQLRREQPPVAIIGHYADGGETVRRCCELMREESIPLPRVVHIPHSTGLLKEERLKSEGKEVDPSLRIMDRVRTELGVYESVDVLWSTSADMTESLQNGYGATVHDTVLIGVDTDRFHPREAGVERTDARYAQVWEDLSKASGRPIAELQAAQMVLEYSRTSPAKDKGTTVRAFAESLKGADRDRILVMNVADPSLPGLGPLDREEAANVRNLIEDLGLQGRVIIAHSFPNERCALLGQLADVYISSAVLEPWGMAVQEAAASGVPIIACDKVAIASELLVGKDKGETIYDNGQPVLTKGDGAIMFRKRDFRSAALALNRLLNEDGAAERAALAQGAYNAVIPRCTWPVILPPLYEKHLNLKIENGVVVGVKGNTSER